MTGRNTLKRRRSWIVVLSAKGSSLHGVAQSGAMNRHGVLHGRDVRYPSEANSLRVVLLIAYLIEVHELLLGHEKYVRECNRLIDSLGIECPMGGCPTSQP